jgi:NitT/TauT family transport system ATP-binding protein
MQQRAAVCRMLIAEPSVLLLDEPVGSLDEITREHLNVDLARICRALDAATVFVTHSVQEAVFLADRVAVMTGRPGCFDATVHVTIPHEARDLDVLSSPEFQDHVRHARQLLHRSSLV